MVWRPQDVPNRSCLLWGPSPKPMVCRQITFVSHLCRPATRPVPSMFFLCVFQPQALPVWVEILSAPGWWTAPQPSLTRSCSSDLFSHSTYIKVIFILVPFVYLTGFIIEELYKQVILKLDSKQF